MMSLHSIIQTLQFYIQQKEQNGLKQYINLTLYRLYAIVLKDIFLSHQFKPLQNFSAGEIVLI